MESSVVSLCLRVVLVFRDIIYVIIILYSWQLVIREHFWPYVWNNWSWVMHTMSTWFWHKNRVWQWLCLILDILKICMDFGPYDAFPSSDVPEMVDQQNLWNSLVISIYLLYLEWNVGISYISWQLVICEHFWPYVWSNWSWVMHTMSTWFWHKNWVWQWLCLILDILKICMDFGPYDASRHPMFLKW
jgi:hypothetical protein